MQKVQETRVPSLGQEDPLEEEMAARSSTLSWEIPRTEEPGGVQSIGSSLSHSVVFLYFFALIAEEGFLIAPCSSLDFLFCPTFCGRQ